MKDLVFLKVRTAFFSAFGGGRLVGEAHMFKADVQTAAGKWLFPFLQRRDVEQSFHLIDLIAQLGHHRHKAHGPHQGRPHGEGHTQDQGVVRQRGGPSEHQIAAGWQQHQRHTGQDTGVEGHPQPAGPEPVQGEIPVVLHIGLKPVVGLPIPVEDLHHFHAVDVLHDGVVHLLTGGVVGPHFAHAGTVHHPHGQHPQGKGAEGQQAQLPVSEEHGHEDHHRHGQVGHALRQRMGQQQLHALNVVHEHLLPDPHALLLDGAQGLFLQLALEMEPEVFQGVVGGAVGQGQPLHIEQAVEDHAQGHGAGIQKRLLQGEAAPCQQGPQNAVEEKVGQHAHGHAGHQHQDGGIGGPPVLPGVAEDFLKHEITPFFG